MWNPGLPFFFVTLQLWILRIDYGTPVSITSKNGSNFFDRNHDTFVQNETGAITGIVESNIARQMDTGALKTQHSLRPVFLGKTGKQLNRRKRYLLLRSRWRMQHLSYTISKYPKRTQLLGGKTRVDGEFERAFGIWANVSALTFIRTTTRRPDIDIRFYSGWHSLFCRSFDGQRGVLAHAFSPRHGGHIHFDDDEIWTVDSYDGTNLLQVAVHEVGHAIGIGHSKVAASAMAPKYGGYNPNFELDADDVEAIRALYGEKRLTSTIAPAPETTIAPAPETTIAPAPETSTVPVPKTTTASPPDDSKETETFDALPMIITGVVVSLLIFVCLGIIIIQKYTKCCSQSFLQ